MMMISPAHNQNHKFLVMRRCVSSLAEAVLQGVLLEDGLMMISIDRQHRPRLATAGALVARKASEKVGRAGPPHLAE